MKKILFILLLFLLIFPEEIYSYLEKCGRGTCGWCTQCVNNVCKTCSEITEVKCEGCNKVVCRGTCVNGNCYISDCGNQKTCDLSCKNANGCNWNSACCQTSDQGCGAYGCPSNTKRICTKCEGQTTWTCQCISDSSCGGSQPPTTTTIISCVNIGLQQPIVKTPVYEGDYINISCSVNGRYDCINAYSNIPINDANRCTWTGVLGDSGWTGNSATFRCNPFSQGTYTARCVVNPNTPTKCCADQKDTVYTVIKRVKGYHDFSDCATTYGWACDTSSYPETLTVYIYDGPISNNKLLGTTIANISAEQGVCNECGNTCNHRFSFSMPTSIYDGQQHQIYVYAMDTSDTLRVLANSPKTITCQTRPLQLSLSKNTSTIQRGDGLKITVQAMSDNNYVSNIQINFEIRDKNNQTRSTQSCITLNGQCSIVYELPRTISSNDYGTWTVTATSSPQGYQTAIASTTFNVIECKNSDGCECYEYCSNNKCTDLRPLIQDCMYYDGCQGEDCCQNGVCDDKKCVNVEEAICEDQYYLCHGWFINCGEEEFKFN